MTDNEFTEIDLQKEVSEMEPDEARETLVDFMEAHQTNRTAYDELHSKLDDVETEYQEKLEEKEERISQFKEERASEASEYVKMPDEILAEKFTFSELDQIIEEAEQAEEFSEDDETDEDESEGRLTTFSEKEEKGQAGGNADSGPSERAQNLINKNF